jgi:hypothetical protein
VVVVADRAAVRAGAAQAAVAVGRVAERDVVVGMAAGVVIAKAAISSRT